MRKVLNWFSTALTVFLMVIVIVLAVVVVAAKASGGEPTILGYQLKSVLSGSMEPTFQTGAVIAVKPLEQDEKQSLQKQDIITFQSEEGIPVTHRIHNVIHSGVHTMYETKGDNNNTIDKDLVLSDNVTAKYTGFTIPYAGYFTQFAQSREGSALLLIVPGVFLLIYALFLIITGLKSIQNQQ
ncbi:signal peptidase I [Cytobacillus sp. FSL K6-0129]|uniref:signal peptidase I SipW n=1 Tax=unclassified Cytobacillus TaxID=2675268 RepID=UPI0030F807E1